MSKTPFSNKCNILRNLMEGPMDTLIEKREDWQEYFDDHAIGLNLAWLVDRNYAVVNDDVPNGLAVIDDAWLYFCVMLHIDYADKYDSLDDCLAAGLEATKE